MAEKKGKKRIIAQKINIVHDKDYINLVVDTLNIGKQALVFVNTKNRAESSAQEISGLYKPKRSDKEALLKVSSGILHALSRPTVQCLKLSECVKNGVAFHHSGLVSEQRNIIEENFKNGLIKVICSTPTLAAGLDLPAFRVIIRDLLRHSKRGLSYIPVLEYLQQAGRAGRPKYDSFGEAVCVASNEKSRKDIVKRYLHGEPEEIYSKLAVEPVLRTYVLSMIVLGHARSRDELMNFFSKTFWAFQFKDLDKIEMILEKTLELLENWGMIKEVKRDAALPDKGIEEKDEGMFISAESLSKKGVDMGSSSSFGLNKTYVATILGRRVAETYVDPYTANHIVLGLLRAKADGNFNPFGMLHTVCHTLELRPLLSVKSSEIEDIEDFYIKNEGLFFEKEPSYYDLEYNEYLESIKTALALNDWIEEKDEDFILENYNLVPGVLRSKIEICDWLLYCSMEFARIVEYHKAINEISKLRMRLKYGAKEELIALLKIKNIGKSRARALYGKGIKSVGDISKAGLARLSVILGESIAKTIIKEVNGKSLGEHKEVIKGNDGKELNPLENENDLGKKISDKKDNEIIKIRRKKSCRQFNLSDFS
jgi:helicase